VGALRVGGMPPVENLGATSFLLAHIAPFVHTFLLKTRTYTVDAVLLGRPLITGFSVLPLVAFSKDPQYRRRLLVASTMWVSSYCTFIDMAP
jgi:hypothetical protein